MVFSVPSRLVYKIRKQGEKGMHLFETEEGDKWVCVACGLEQAQLIEEKKWEFIFDKDNPMLRCSFCGQGDYEIED
jgi:hypothetical protein